jgi:hypothetical protein
MKNYFLHCCLFLVTSCALTNIHMNKTHEPKLKKTVLNKAIYIEVDYKPSKKVGVKKGGYGNETAEVYLDKAQSDWLKEALTAEFSAYGYEVLLKPNPRTPHLKVSINQLFVEPDVGFWAAKMVAICDLDVSLQTKDKKSYRRNFVELEESTELVWTDNDFITRFTGAVDNTLSSVVFNTHQFLASKDK